MNSLLKIGLYALATALQHVAGPVLQDPGEAYLQCRELAELLHALHVYWPYIKLTAWRVGQGCRRSARG